MAVATVTAIVSSLGAPLVPRIAASYDVSVSTAQWVLTATMIAAAATTPVLGRWASGRLRRPIMLGSLGVVLAGLVLSALPLGIAPLVLGRALQGLGLAVAPLTLAVARDVWRGDRLISRLSLLSIASVAGAGLGYPVTAGVATCAGVRGAYWFGAALVAAAVLLAWRHLPRAAAGTPQHVDVVGAALVAAAMVTVLLGVSRGEQWGWTSTPVLGLVLVGPALGAGWCLHTLRLSARGGQPLVDLRLAARRGIRSSHAVALALAVAMYGLLTIAVLLVQADGSAGWGLGRGVLTGGVVLVPYSLMSVIGSRIAIQVSHRFGASALLPTGCTVFACALVLLAGGHQHLWQVLLAMGVGGLGGGFSFSSMALLIVPHVPAAETGSALAFNQLLRYLGFAAGSATSVALLEVYGGDEPAFRATALTLAGVCLLAALTTLFDRAPRGPASGPRARL